MDHSRAIGAATVWLLLFAILVGRSILHRIYAPEPIEIAKVQ